MPQPLFTTLDRSRSVSSQEAAEVLGVKRQTIERWARAGRLLGIAYKTPGARGMWRFKRAELEDWFKNLTK